MMGRLLLLLPLMFRSVFHSVLRSGAGGWGVAVCLCVAGCRIDPPLFKPDKQRREELRLANAEKLVLMGAVKPEHEVAAKVMDLPGYVRTPYTHPRLLVDVRGLRPGSLVVCPFTGKLFNLPMDFVDASPTAGHPTPPKQRFELVPSGTRIAEEVAAVQAAAAAKVATAPAAAAVTAAKSPALPYGRAVPGKPGFVYSPYAANHQVVDVTGLAPGMEVKCPYSGRLFRVPEK